MNQRYLGFINIDNIRTTIFINAVDTKSTKVGNRAIQLNIFIFMMSSVGI